MTEKNYVFAVEGSTGNAYTVKFFLRGETAYASCTCQAGENGKHCKHRIAIMSGDIAAIIGGEKTDVVKLREGLKGTPLQAALENYLDADKNYSAAKGSLDGAKRRLDSAFKGKEK